MRSLVNKAKFLVPVVLCTALVACGNPPPPPTVAIPNPLSSLPTDLSNTDMNAALQGINALGQLSQSIDASGQLQNQAALDGFANALSQIDKQRATQEYGMIEPVDFPQGVPDLLSQFKYTNGKLVGASFESSDPIDVRLTYQTLDSVIQATSFYRQLIKNPLPDGWRVKGQLGGAESGHIELQRLQGTTDDRMYIEFLNDYGMTTIKIRYYNYSR